MVVLVIFKYKEHFMKKLLLALLVLAMCVFVCACGKGNNANSTALQTTSDFPTDENESSQSVNNTECLHEWNSASCEKPEICKHCGKTNGAALEHDWFAATCTTPKTCSSCGKTDGAALGHAYSSGTCKDPEFCNRCGAEGAYGLHSWKKTNCEKPEECVVCGETKTENSGHIWTDATCTSPKTCKDCGETSGVASEHNWKNATCRAPKTCKTCGATSGSASEHDWKSATCSSPKTCMECGTTNGSALGHSWKPATCKAPKTCKTCGKTEGSKGSHNYSSGYCTVCGNKDSNFVAEFKAGEKWAVPDQWEFTLTAANEHTHCSSYLTKYEGFTNEQIVMLKFKYKNIGFGSKFAPEISNIVVVDEDGEMARLYSSVSSTLIGCDHGIEPEEVMQTMSVSAALPYALNNKSQKLTVIVTIKDSEGTEQKAKFSTSITPLPEEEEEDKLNGCTITIDTSLPKTISYYNYNGTISSSCQVTEITFEVSGDDLYIYMTGRKTYDSNGSGQSSACMIGWKLYDANNYVVDDGTLYTNSLAIGEGFLKAKDTAYNVIVPGESYRLVILNVN